jgi:hypothetical protein
MPAAGTTAFEGSTGCTQYKVVRTGGRIGSRTPAIGLPHMRRAASWLRRALHPQLSATDTRELARNRFRLNRLAL